MHVLYHSICMCSLHQFATNFPLTRNTRIFFCDLPWSEVNGEGQAAQEISGSHKGRVGTRKGHFTNFLMSVFVLMAWEVSTQKNKKPAANNNRGGFVIRSKIRNLRETTLDQNKTQIILDFFCDFGKAIPGLCDCQKLPGLPDLLHWPLIKVNHQKNPSVSTATEITCISVEWDMCSHHIF